MMLRAFEFTFRETKKESSSRTAEVAGRQRKAGGERCQALYTTLAAAVGAAPTPAPLPPLAGCSTCSRPDRLSRLLKEEVRSSSSWCARCSEACRHACGGRIEGGHVHSAGCAKTACTGCAVNACSFAPPHDMPVPATLQPHLPSGCCRKRGPVRQQQAAQPGRQPCRLLRMLLQPLHEQLQQRHRVRRAQLGHTVVNDGCVLHCAGTGRRWVRHARKRQMLLCPSEQLLDSCSAHASLALLTL